MADPNQLGGYDVLARLNAGGMATLYLAQRSGPAGFKKQVAIKVLKPHLANNQKFIEMFIDEARIAARISHPNVVHIEELGETDDGEYFLVMEYLHGAALSEVLMALAKRELRLTPAMAVAITMASASGLHAAHETRDESGRLLDVIHRDVSPQNILVGARGEVKVIDFGIAKARDRLHVTDAGSGVKGKLRYMAPEQLRGGDIDRRVDVYSLGVVLWEMLAMRRLFQGQTDPQVITRITKGEMPPPGAFADVPFGLDGVVLECLASDPTRRPETARSMRQKLKATVPEAAAIERGEIASLVWALLGPKMMQRAEGLPGVGTTLQTIELDLTPEEAIQRFTEPLDHVVHDGETVVALGVEDDPTEVSDGSGALAAPSPRMGTGASHRPEALQPAPVSPPPAPSSTSSAKLILIVAIAILVGAIAAVAVLGALREEPAPPPVQVVPPG